MVGDENTPGSADSQPSSRLSAEQQLDVLRQLSQELAQADDTRSVLWIIARSTMTMLGYEDCVIYLVEHRPTGPVLVQRAAHGPKSPDGAEIVDPIELGLGVGIVGHCAVAAEPVLVADTSQDARYVIDDATRGSELAVPILDDGEVIGVIDSEHSQPGFYTHADQQAVVDIAAMASARLRTALTIEQLERNVDALEKTRAELDRLARTDGLTGLLNRRGLEEVLNDFDGLEPMAAAVLDIDQFKVLNDTHGHQCGDAVLVKMAEIILNSTETTRLRASRLGGDEFIVVGDGLHDLERVMLTILHTVRTTAFRHDAAEVAVTVSIGIARGQRDDVWGLADEALYLAKSGGRDQMVMYDENDPQLQARRSDMQRVEEVRQAIASDSLLLYSQPIIDVSLPGEPAAYHEVLLRRPTPDGGVASPGPLLNAAERFGLIERLDFWVLSRSLGWLSKQPRSTKLSINLSTDFTCSLHAIPNLNRLLEQSGVAPRQVCLEITETTAIRDLQRAAIFVSTVRRWGCEVAIDDFGSGWSSLPLIQDLNVDIVKIDGSWIQKATKDPLACSVVTSAVEMANIIGVQLVAEWVADLETLAFVKDLGIRYVQGYLYGVPVPLTFLEAKL